MTSTFRARLFRLFLLFAIIPTLLVTALSYYFLYSMGTGGAPTLSGPASDLSRYYNEYLFGRIERQVVQYAAGGSALATGLDFLFTSQSSRTSRVVGGEDELPDRALAEIVKAALDRPRGFVEWHDQFYQYAARRLPSGNFVYGGFVYGKDFAALVETVRSDIAVRSTAPEIRTQYVYFLGALLVVLLLITYLTAYLFSSRLSRSLARPLLELSDASGKIAVGEFKQTVAVSGTAELRTLIGNFNDMAARLDRTTSLLAQTERVAAWRQVARRFAHELKNPLQPILVSLYRIEKQLVDTDAYDKIYEPLKAAADEVKHLSLLADRFSELAKLPPPTIAEINLNNVCQSIAELYRDRLAGISFTMALPENAIVVWTDAAYLREAVHNLLQNAIDACTENGRVHLALERGSSEVRLSVADNGAGMDAATLASARLPYFTTKEKGTGLGLAIAEKSISELGGRLTIESSKGLGTRVTIILPL